MGGGEGGGEGRDVMRELETNFSVPAFEELQKKWRYLVRGRRVRALLQGCPRIEGAASLNSC